jgi:hypothetical protein
MSVEAKMHFNRSLIVEYKEKIFAFASDGVDAPTGKKFRDVGRGLRQHRDWMKYLHAANSALCPEPPE